MKTTNKADNDLVPYLTNAENLACTLEILKLEKDIRRRVFRDFWHELDVKLEKARPGHLQSAKFEKKFWPDEQRLGTESAGIYMWPSRFTNQSQVINYGLAIDSNQSVFFGLSWEQEAKAAHHKKADVAELLAFLARNTFKTTKWWLGWKYLVRNEEPDGLLMRYANERRHLYREISESFWPFVGETFDLVVAANKSLMS